MGLKFREWKFVVFLKSMITEFCQCKIKDILLASNLANDQWNNQTKCTANIKKYLSISKPWFSVAKFQSVRGAPSLLDQELPSFTVYYLWPYVKMLVNFHLCPNFQVNGCEIGLEGSIEMVLLIKNPVSFGSVF